MNKEYILIADDDADDREMLRDAFMNSTPNKEYIFVENGDKLIDYLQQHIDSGPPSLILLDLNMPGKDGREALKEIKTNKLFSHIPIIAFTTSSSYRDKAISYELGANCFITKPDTFNKLVDITRSISRLWLQ
jgi:CheY-like chemotaxis protein